MTDGKIISLIRKRDEKGLAELNNKYRAYMLKTAKNVVGSDETAEECLNDALLTVWEKLQYTEVSDLKAYFAKTVRNHALNAYRAMSRDKRGGGQADSALDELEDCLPSSSSVEDTVTAQELQRAVNAFVSKLGKNEKTAFVGRYFYAMPIGEIASALSLSESRVRGILYETRINLKKYLEKEKWL